jgi:hypothetical protein
VAALPLRGKRGTLADAARTAELDVGMHRAGFVGHLTSFVRWCRDRVGPVASATILTLAMHHVEHVVASRQAPSPEGAVSQRHELE